MHMHSLQVSLLLKFSSQPCTLQTQPADTMALLFTVIARGNTILAKYASCAGNFSEVVEQVLARISPENGRLTYSHGR